MVTLKPLFSPAITRLARLFALPEKTRPVSSGRFHSNWWPSRQHCLLVAIGLFAPSATAQDSLEPLIETLQLQQKSAYQRAAPSGNDAPLPAPVVEVAIPRARVQIADESVLEEQGQAVNEPITLDDQKQEQVTQADLRQFGYDIFEQVPTTFAPVESIPVPSDYVVGPGDNIIVQLYGKKNVEYNLVVTRENRLLIPELGPVNVGGMTFDEMKDVIINDFDQRVIGAKVAVTMGPVRTIQIRLAGDVVKPGVYTLGGLTTLVDALLATGGVSTSGSLRQIEVRRTGKRIARFDLYDLLLNGDASNDIQLKHKDVIFAPPVGDVVYVAGEVQRPAIYELRNEENVRDIITVAGGLLAGASLKDSHIERIIPGQHRTLVELGSRLEDTTKLEIRNGDFLRILPLDNTLEDVVLLSGNVLRPGGYPFRKNMRVSDLIVNIDRTLANTDLDLAMIVRENSKTRRTEVHYFNLADALTNPTSYANHTLRARDEVRVFNLDSVRADELAGLVRELDTQTTGSRPSRTFTVTGHARFTGRFPLEEDRPLLELLRVSGGILPGTDLDYGVIARTQIPDNQVTMLSFSLRKALQNIKSKANPTIWPGDRIYLFDDRIDRSNVMRKDLDELARQTSYTQHAPLVHINGRVAHPGEYPLEENMRVSDLLCAAGGLTRKAYGLRAELSRYSKAGDTNNELTHTALNTQGLSALCDSQKITNPTNGNLSANQSKALYLNNDRNPILHRRDQLTFVDKPDFVDTASVTLSGEIVRPGTYVIDRGETLCSVIRRAGGLTPAAYVFGAELTRVSTQKMQQRTLNAIQDQLDDLLVDLSLSHSANNNAKTPAGEQKDEFIRVIKQLARAKPNGRMVIDLEAASRCKSHADIVLEQGDRLHVPLRPTHVTVAGQVYVPTSHLYRDDRRARDYIKLSGGSTVLGRISHAYIIQANGEVRGMKRRRLSKRILRQKVQPGARIIVPLNVDRMNTTERLQSWARSLFETAVLAGIVL